ncbi:MAG TPA: hypothetical protein VMM38_16130 [Aridibacter sp.]|nr:hypothetical protein [Aridibacter sp.]
MFNFYLKSILSAALLTLLACSSAFSQDIEDSDGGTEVGVDCELLNLPPKISKVDITNGSDLQNCSLESPTCAFIWPVLTVSVAGDDPERDVLTYNYKVSGGKIIGKGPLVKWDLSEMDSGEYSLEICLDDGAGCFEKNTVTKKVIIVSKLDPNKYGEFADGFKLSRDPQSGIVVSGWGVPRSTRRAEIFNESPVTLYFISEKSLVSECDSETCTAETSIQLWADATDPENDVIVFLYRTNAGKIEGKGKSVVWNLRGVSPGTYKVEVCVDDGSGCEDPERWKKLEMTVR